MLGTRRQEGFVPPLEQDTVAAGHEKRLGHCKTVALAGLAGLRAPFAVLRIRQRAQASKPSQRYGLAVSEALFMASRDGVLFKRWNEAFLPPGLEHPGSWAYGNQYIGWQMLETHSAIAGAPDELSLYATENYWLGAKGSELRRYSLRMDGFVSVQAPMSGGEIVTKPVRFQGKHLALNFGTSAAGSIRVEIQDAEGHALPGFTLEDCPPLFGNTLERAVTWNQGADVGTVAGKAVRLRFEIKDGDLYSFQFKE